MAALLVSLAVMSIMMSVAMPVWRHEAQREKEAELVFRGQQYVRAIRLFQQKTGTFPTSVDILVQGNYLRKKYKDPITNEEFEYVGAAVSPGQVGPPGPGQTGMPGRGGPGTTSDGRGGFSTTSGRVGQPPAGGFGSGSGTTSGGSVSGGVIPGGMMGVRSKSKEESIRLYAGRNHYNEWVFNYVGQQQMPGGPGRGQPGGVGGPGGRGGPVGPGRGGPPGLPGGPGTGPGRGRAGPPPPPPGFPGGPGRGRM
jgi:type II secretory pathway pseudopilin PulG